MINLNDIKVLEIISIAFVAIVIFVMLSFSIVGGIAFNKTEKGAGRSFGMLLIRGNILRVAAVVFCIFAVVVLSVVGRLSEGAVSILSGVAGFVLGGWRSGSEHGSPPD